MKKLIKPQEYIRNDKSLFTFQADKEYYLSDLISSFIQNDEELLDLSECFLKAESSYDEDDLFVELCRDK